MTPTITKNLLYIKHALVVLLVYSALFFSIVGAKAEPLYNLNIKQVLLTDDNINSNYEYGKNLYPEYSYCGLPDNFLIKKTPDLTIAPEHIKLVEISKMHSLTRMPAFTVVIHFDSPTASQINAYTKQHMNEEIALEIDNKIFVIAKNLGSSGKEVQIALVKENIEALEEDLKKICSNVVIVGNHNSN